MNPKSNAGAAIKLLKGGVAPQLAAAGTVTGSWLDVRGYESCVLSVFTGAIAGTPSAQTVDCKLQYSNDGSNSLGDYAPPTPYPGTATAAIAQITAANTEKHVNVNLAGANYVRAVATVAFTDGTSPTIGLAVAVALTGPTNLNPPPTY